MSAYGNTYKCEAFIEGKEILNQVIDFSKENPMRSQKNPNFDIEAIYHKDTVVFELGTIVPQNATYIGVGGPKNADRLLTQGLIPGTKTMFYLDCIKLLEK